jgi:hypothetical protein
VDRSVAGHTDCSLADWKGEAGSRRLKGAESPERATIRAGGAESADIPLSDREPVEGFHLTTMTAMVLIATAVTTTSPPQIVTFTPRL